VLGAESTVFGAGKNCNAADIILAISPRKTTFYQQLPFWLQIGKKDPTARARLKLNAHRAAGQFALIKSCG